MHSATKWIGGHGIAIGGVIVDGGRFDWQASGKFPTLTEPYAGYHGIVFAEQFGPPAFIMRARTEGLRDFGACLSRPTPFSCCRASRPWPSHGAAHGQYPCGARIPGPNKAVAWVLHPDRWQSHPDHAARPSDCCRAARAPSSASASRAAGAAGRSSSKRCELISHLANVGDAKTLVIHPASTTHQQMDAARLKAAGIGEDMVRLSVGIEDADDIIDDLGQALRISQKA